MDKKPASSGLTGVWNSRVGHAQLENAGLSANLTQYDVDYCGIQRSRFAGQTGGVAADKALGQRGSKDRYRDL